MKLVVTGATGLIGGEALSQALTHPNVTEVVTLARRTIPADKLPSSFKSKLTQLELKNGDWLDYPDAVKKEIKGATGWVWALGSLQFPDDETERRVPLDYALTALNAIAKLQEGQEHPKPVNFALCSGKLTEKDETKHLWFLEEFRKFRGYVEKEIMKWAPEHTSQVQVTIARPGGVAWTGFPLSGLFQLTGYVIGVDQLGASFVNLASKGRSSPDIIVENEQLRSEGIALLNAQSANEVTPA